MNTIYKYAVLNVLTLTRQYIMTFDISMWLEFVLISAETNNWVSAIVLILYHCLNVSWYNDTLIWYIVPWHIARPTNQSDLWDIVMVVVFLVQAQHAVDQWWQLSIELFLRQQVNSKSYGFSHSQSNLWKQETYTAIKVFMYYKLWYHTL